MASEYTAVNPPISVFRFSSTTLRYIVLTTFWPIIERCWYQTTGCKWPPSQHSRPTGSWSNLSVLSPAYYLAGSRLIRYYIPFYLCLFIADNIWIFTTSLTHRRRPWTRSYRGYFSSKVCCNGQQIAANVWDPRVLQRYPIIATIKFTRSQNVLVATRCKWPGSKAEILLANSLLGILLPQ
jgi:hypothetical protein